ncbi:MAG: hypothetical protein WBI63_08930 [Coriobacteriia bacterium]
MSLLDALLAIVLACVLGYVVPWGFVAMLAPALRTSERAFVTNYRGRQVFLGLGLAWLVWAGCAIIVGTVSVSAFPAVATATVFTLAGPLALVAFALGMVDDALGSSEARGFRGHLMALINGRLTTGGLKLIGIGAASVVVSFVLSDISPWGAGWRGGIQVVFPALLAAAAISLTSNFVNLTDLRPGRALKVYSVLALAGVISVVLGLGPVAMRFVGVRSPLVELLVLSIMLLGPVLAVWRYDLGEEGMLGDAGANAMGVLAGMFIVAGLPLWALAVYAAVLLGLNLLSEHVSFSALIERTTLLAWLDSLGRLPLDPPIAESPESPESSAQVPTDVGAKRYHPREDHDSREA